MAIRYGKDEMCVVAGCPYKAGDHRFIHKYPGLCKMCALHALLACEE